jgi:hypothetical protein
MKNYDRKINSFRSRTSFKGNPRKALNEIFTIFLKNSKTIEGKKEAPVMIKRSLLNCFHNSCDCFLFYRLTVKKRFISQICLHALKFLHLNFLSALEAYTVSSFFKRTCVTRNIVRNILPFSDKC